RLQYQSGAHFVTVGGEYRGRWVDQRSSYEFVDGSVAPGTLHDAKITGHLAVAYAQEEWRPVTPLALIVGANFADTKPGGERAQPRAAVIVKPKPHLSLKALYTEGFRPPSIFEASYVDYVTQIPNPALRSERIRSGELSVVW